MNITLIADDPAFINLPCPIPSWGTFPISRYLPGCSFKYTAKQVTPNSLDATWINRSGPCDGEFLMRLILESTCDFGPDPFGYWWDNLDRWVEIGVPVYASPLDANFGRGWTDMQDGGWYKLQLIIAQHFQKRRFAAGWHPQVHVVDTRKKVADFDGIHKKALKTKKQPRLQIKRITERKPICIFNKL